MDKKEGEMNKKDVEGKVRVIKMSDEVAIFNKKGKPPPVVEK